TDVCVPGRDRPNWCDAPPSSPFAWPAVIAGATTALGIGPAGARAEKLMVRLSHPGQAVQVSAAAQTSAGVVFGNAEVLPDGAVLLPQYGSGFGFLMLTDQDGCYRVSMRAQDGFPPPVQLELSIGARHWTFEFDRGDNGWSEREVVVGLTAGRHVGR